MNVPVAASNFGPLRELLPTDTLIAGWNVESYANMVVELSTDPESRKAHIQKIGNKAASLTWTDCANQMVDAFFDIAMRERAPLNIGGAEFDASIKFAQERFTNSMSWKVTAPLRALHKMLTRR
jgi:hypothetical protein